MHSFPSSLVLLNNSHCLLLHRLAPKTRCSLVVWCQTSELRWRGDQHALIVFAFPLSCMENPNDSSAFPCILWWNASCAQIHTHTSPDVTVCLKEPTTTTPSHSETGSDPHQTVELWWTAGRDVTINALKLASRSFALCGSVNPAGFMLRLICVHIH